VVLLSNWLQFLRKFKDWAQYGGANQKKTVRYFLAFRRRDEPAVVFVIYGRWFADEDVHPTNWHEPLMWVLPTPAFGRIGGRIYSFQAWPVPSSRREFRTKIVNLGAAMGLSMPPKRPMRSLQISGKNARKSSQTKRRESLQGDDI